jgi:dihydroflavonol-4-reductase
VRAFVTGGTGFVGSHLVDLLLAGGHEVACLVRSPAKAEALFERARPTLIPGSLTDDEALRRGAEGAEVIFHVAGLTSARSRAELFAVNEEGTRRVVAAAPRSLHRIVYVSSLAAAGPSTRGRQLQGDEPEHPVTPYGASKLAGERAVRGGGLPWTIVRPPAVYGPRDVELLRVFRLARRGITPVFGDGSQELSLIYVEDLARALLAAARARDAVGRTYFAAHPDVVRSRAFVLAVGRAVRPDARPPIVVPLPTPVARAALWVTGLAAKLTRRATVLTPDKANELLADAWTCSPAALERDTGWTPNYSLAAGLAKTVAWYRERGWL